LPQAIYEAIAAGDGDAAAEAMRVLVDLAMKDTAEEMGLSALPQPGMDPA